MKVEYYENGGLAVAAVRCDDRLCAAASASACTGAAPDTAPDTTPPSQPKNLAISDASRSSVELMWSPSTDNLGVTGYGTYADGDQVGTTPNRAPRFRSSRVVLRTCSRRTPWTLPETARPRHP